MESTCLCKIDELGRIMLPGRIREECGWEVRDVLALSVEGDTLVLKLSETDSLKSCIICGREEAARVVSGKGICECCIREISK